MTLRDEIWEQLPDSVTSLRVDKSDIHGLESVRVTVYYRSIDDKPMFLALNFARKNQMNGEHIGAVIRSYLRNGIASRDDV